MAMQAEQTPIEHTRLHNDLHQGLVQGPSFGAVVCALCNQNLKQCDVIYSERDGFADYHLDCILDALKDEPVAHCVSCGGDIPQLFPEGVRARCLNGALVHEVCITYTPAKRTP